MNYNGWTNYATWRVNLEVFDGVSLGDIGGFTEDTEDETVEVVQNYVQAYVDSLDINGIALGWINAFLSDVNYREIARNLRVANQ